MALFQPTATVQCSVNKPHAHAYVREKAVAKHGPFQKPEF